MHESLNVLAKALKIVHYKKNFQGSDGNLSEGRTMTDRGGHPKDPDINVRHHFRDRRYYDQRQAGRDFPGMPQIPHFHSELTEWTGGIQARA